MGKLFLARMPDGTERFAADLSMGRSRVFFDLTRLVEQYVGVTSGIAPDNGEDEHLIEPALFARFFERAWQEDWFAERASGLLYPWAQLAAGMLENITGEHRTWIDRNGEPLDVKRYCAPKD